MTNQKQRIVKDVRLRWWELQHRIEVRLNEKRPENAKGFLVKPFSAHWTRISSHRLWAETQNLWMTYFDNIGDQSIPKFCAGHRAICGGEVVFRDDCPWSGYPLHNEPCAIKSEEQWVESVLKPVNEHRKKVTKTFIGLEQSSRGKPKDPNVQDRRQFVFEQRQQGKSYNDIMDLVNEPSRPWFVKGHKISVEVLRQDFSKFKKLLET